MDQPKTTQTHAHIFFNQIYHFCITKCKTEAQTTEKMKMRALIYMTLITTLAAICQAQQLSSKECENMGFTGLSLCSDCKTLSEYVKDQELVSDCLKCCVEDSDDSTSKITYAGALLEVCMRKLVFYPEIVGFIEEENDKFPSVKVQYSFNSPPKMIMLDDNGEHAETIRIDNWKREHILQFLRGKLKSAAS